jgi:hypothetical protein
VLLLCDVDHGHITSARWISLGQISCAFAVVANGLAVTSATGLENQDLWPFLLTVEFWPGGVGETHGDAKERTTFLAKRGFKAMTCDMVGTDRSLFVAWGTPDLEDLERVAAQVKLRFELTNSPILYVTRVPERAPVPSPAVRAELARLLPAVLDRCADYYVVLEGDGFSSAMKRAVLLGLFQLTPTRGKLHVYGSVDEFRHRVPNIWRADSDRLLHLAEQRDLLEGPIPVERIEQVSGAYFVGKTRPKPVKDSNVA